MLDNNCRSYLDSLSTGLDRVTVMGDAKRRKESGKPESKRIISWLPLTTTQSADFVRVSTQGAWIGIGLLVFGWFMVRWIGPSFGWWQIIG